MMTWQVVAAFVLGLWVGLAAAGVVALVAVLRSLGGPALPGPADREWPAPGGGAS